MMEFSLIRERTRIRLGQELGRGGEGVVFALEGLKDRVAKIYTVPPDPKKAQKLFVMAGAGTPALLKIAAWPVDLLSDGTGAIRGFIMPRVVGRKDIHELYSPKTRADAFPEADFRFIAHVAANIARAFAVVHEHGHVLGDVNHGNLLVGTDGTVMLIDCDSFQVGDGTNVFTCDVGVPLFTAPEIHGHTFRGMVRTTNHDRFGLAVLLFHLLYMGRHPFAGRYLGKGDMPIEKAVAEYRFAYGPDRFVTQMERPPGTIPLETMGGVISFLFIRAFGPVDSNGRPEAKMWVEALEKLKNSLRVCPKAPNHHYPVELQTCPWCTIESQTGARLFGQKIAAFTVGGVINLATLWDAILAAPDPGADPELPSGRPWKLPVGVKVPIGFIKILRKAVSIGLVLAGLTSCNALAKDGGVLLGLFLYGLAIAVWPKVSPEALAAANGAVSAAKIDWDAVLGRWKREASREVYSKKMVFLEKTKTEFADLPNEYRRRITRLEVERENRQRQRYLDRFRIDRGQIRGIGTGRSSMLASYGIETAADIDQAKILQIPGFGEGLTAELVGWRKKHEQNFRFNPAEPVEKRDVDSLDNEFEQRKQTLLSTLQHGPDALRRLSMDINAARQRLLPVLETTWNALKIAEARRKAL